MAREITKANRCGLVTLMIFYLVLLLVSFCHYRLFADEERLFIVVVWLPNSLGIRS